MFWLRRQFPQAARSPWCRWAREGTRHRRASIGGAPTVPDRVWRAARRTRVWRSSQDRSRFSRSAARTDGIDQGGAEVPVFERAGDIQGEVIVSRSAAAGRLGRDGRGSLF